MRLSEAAGLLGVHYQTAYGWVRDGSLPAHLVAGGYEVTEDDVRDFQTRRRLGRDPSAQLQERDWVSQAGRLYRAIVDGQETAARRAMDRLAGRVSKTDLCDRLIAPALRQVGDGWAAGLVSIAQEHRAAAICERLIAVNSSQPAGRPRGTAVVATPQDERHGLPALMATICLREHRWYVHHLAADLPATEIARLASSVEADLVVLSTATPTGVERASEAARLVLALAPGVAVLTGHSGDTLTDLADQAARVRPERAPTLAC
jgi:excisionase family DNA binding protein